MSISFEIPPELERQLNSTNPELSRKAREAFFVELYRDRRISHRQLAELLDLERYETDGLLKRYGLGLDVSTDEIRAEAALLRDVRPR